MADQFDASVSDQVSAQPDPMAEGIQAQQQPGGAPTQINLHAMMQRDGLRLVGLNDDGSPRVRMPDGNIQNLDLPAMMKADGIDPARTKILYNTPNSPVQISPLDFKDYVAVEGVNPGLDKEERAKPWLHEHFDQVAQNDRGVVVQKNGVWYQLNPKFLGEGDAYDKTGQLMKSLTATAAEVAPQIAGHSLSVLAGIGATAAAAPFLGPAAPAVGAMTWLANEYALGYLGGGLKMSLGRALGTYDATPEEEAKDLQTEGLLRMGGAALGEGIRLNLPLVTGAMGDIGSRATDAVKDTLSGIFGRSTVDSPGTVRAMFDHAPEVGAKMTAALKEAGGERTAAIQAANNAAETAARSMAEEGPTALTKWYGKGLEHIVDAADGSFDTDFRKGVDQVFDALRDDGIIDVSQKSVRSEVPTTVSRPMASGLQDALGQALSGTQEGTQTVITKKWAMRAFDEAERAGMDQSVDLSDPKALNQVKGIIQKLVDYRKLGEMGGSDAARALNNLHRELNGMTDAVFDGGRTPQFERVVQKTLEHVKGWIGDEFERNGLGEEYGQLAELYKKYGDGVAMMRKVDQSGNVTPIINQIRDTYHLGKVHLGVAMSPEKAAFLQNNPVMAVADLLGDRGTGLVDDVMHNHVAAQFLPRFQMGTRQAVIAGSIITGTGSGWISPVAAAGLALHSSPAFIAAEARGAASVARPVAQAFGTIDELAGRAANSWLKGLSDIERTQFLQNNDLVGQFFKTIAQNVYGHHQTVSAAQNMIDAGKTIATRPQDIVSDADTAKSVGQAIADTPILDAAPHALMGPVLLAGKSAAAHIAPILGEKLASLAATPLILGAIKGQTALEQLHHAVEMSPRIAQEIEQFAKDIKQVSPEALKAAEGGVHQMGTIPRALIDPKGKLYELPGGLGHDSALQALTGKSMQEAVNDGWGTVGHGGLHSFSVDMGNAAQMRTLRQVVRAHVDEPNFYLQQVASAGKTTGLNAVEGQYDTEAFAKKGYLLPHLETK